jgi:T5SS/PEP-CTERM-associated repeat protein
MKTMRETAGKYLAAVLLAAGIWASPALAQFSANDQANTYDNVITDYGGTYYFNYANCTLVITNNGKLINTIAYIGDNAAAVNNRILVTGSGSVWTNSQGRFRMGSAGGSGQHMTIEKGGLVTCTEASINYSAGNCTVLVTGTGSRWISRSSGLSVGQNSLGARLTVTDSGHVYSAGNISYAGNAGADTRVEISNGGTWTNMHQLYVGNSVAASNNHVLVTGAGSRLYNSSRLRLGSGTGASYNRMTITNGGYVYNTEGIIGYAGNATENRVLVTGTGSVWDVGGSFVYVGSGGSNNVLTIADGGTVRGASGVIGAGGRYNAALVTGEGSIWSNGTVFVGTSGPYSRLTIADGGKVFGGLTRMGNTSASSNNTAVITGAGSTWYSSSLEISHGAPGSGVILGTGGVAAVSGTAYVKTGGYVTNHVAEVAGGFNVGGLSLVGNMAIIFAAAPTELGPFWGLRWAGNNVAALQSATNSGLLTIADGPGLPEYWRDRASIYYDGTATYVGFDVTGFPPPTGTVITIR